jgi:hypothetical protein
MTLPITETGRESLPKQNYSQPTPSSWQDYRHEEDYGPLMSFEVVYLDPTDGEIRTIDVEVGLVAGRDPGDGGLALGSAKVDMTLSSKAVAFLQKGDELEIRNTSTYANIEVQRSVGALFLAPGEAFIAHETISIVIPGDSFRHEIRLNFAPGKSSMSVNASGTRTFIPTDLGLPKERQSVLAALCAPLFYPNEYNNELMTAPDIARFLRRFGEDVTPKAVNHKIQRTKDALEEKLGTYIGSRQELAVILRDTGLVNRADIDRLRNPDS